MRLYVLQTFTTGSILAVTMKDPHAGGKTNRFVGICTQRSGSGLGATFILRNIIDGQGTVALFSCEIIIKALAYCSFGYTVWTCKV